VPGSVVRSAVAEAHGAAEQALGLLDPRVTVDGYAASLVALSGFHAAVEDELRCAVEQGRLEPSLVGRPRVPDLERDLELLGVPEPRPSCSVPHLAGEDGAFAGAYVLAGSSLGARVLQRSLPQSVTGSARTYIERGADPHAGSRWARIKLLLEQADAARRARIASHAIALFDTLERHCRTTRRLRGAD
jgi:heme oxygenase